MSPEADNLSRTIADVTGHEVTGESGRAGHGYGAYTRGCRCETCRAAKADYQRARRAGATVSAGGVVSGITHGRYGYEERGCRCEICCGARRSMNREVKRRRRHRVVTARRALVDAEQVRRWDDDAAIDGERDQLVEGVVGT